MMALSEILLSRVPPTAGESLAASADLEGWLQRLVRDAQTAWPGVAVPAELFVAYLADRVGDDDDAKSIGKLLTNDLYLACACVLGESSAIEAFERGPMANLDGALHELDKGKGITAEIKQRVREKMLTAPEGELPGIAGFRGKGSLQAWVRIIAIRMGYRILEKGKKQVELKDTHLGDVTGDMELEYFKEKYKGDFAAAFEQALEVLEKRERTLLRMTIIDGLSCSQIGAMYSVNKSTASRWLSTAREKLADATKDILKQRLNLSPSEVESMVRMVRSRIDLSMHRLLATQHK